MNAFLPPEILGEISTHYVHDRPKIRKVDVEEESAPLRCTTAYPDSQTLPTDLTQVCRLWRGTAISIPQLWAKIYVSNPCCQGCVKTFELWLERSAGSDGRHPLDLTIKQGVGWGTNKQMHFQRIICLAILQHQRWRCISLELYNDCEPLFKALQATAFSILREFKISLRFWTTDGRHRLLSALCSSPALQSIAFGRWFPEYDFNIPFFNIVPWGRLTTLAFTSIMHEAFLDIASSCVKTLQHVSVLRLDEGTIPEIDIPDITMCQLQSMHIDKVIIRDYYHDIGAVFDKLTLPSLCTFRLPNGFSESVHPEITARGWRSLTSLLERSNCKLQTFEFGDGENPGWPLTEAPLTENLSSPLFEHLTDLRVTSKIGLKPDSPQLLDALSEACKDVQTPRMLPLLETLVLDSVSSVESVREMVSARVAAYGGCGGSKLCRVSAGQADGGFVLDMDLASRNCV